MTIERLNALQAELKQATEQIAEWSAIKLKIEGKIEEWGVSAGLLIADGMTGWLPEPRPLSNGHDPTAEVGDARS